MKKKRLLAAALVLLALSGCEKAAPPIPTTESPVLTATPTAPPEEEKPTGSPAPEGPVQTATPRSLEELREILLSAIERVTAPPPLDLSQCPLEGDVEMGLKNIYYGITAEHPELKYAYELTAETMADGLVRCTIAYMPYRQGQLGTEGVNVNSLTELIAAAEDGLGNELVQIRITNPDLAVDDMSRALQQVGGGYFLCALNRDATALTYTPAMGYTMEESLALLEEAKGDAQELVGELLTPEMSQREQLETLYGWLTDNVKYDHRYYADRNTMPYLSTTATGAFEDKVAICGGYAQALDLLCDAIGVESYTVTGQGGGEAHMWTVVLVDGQWRYCDPTFDRGRSQYGYLYFLASAEEMAEKHSWDEAFIKEIIKD